MVGVYASNLFIVAWNTLALNAETSGAGFWISYGLQLGCEVLMATALVAIFTWRRTPIIPILLLTIASNLFYVYATDLKAGRFQDFQQRINTPTFPTSEANDSDVKSAPENESEIMCGFGYFKGRDQQMYLGVGRFSSIEAKYIAMNRKRETAVWDTLLFRWSEGMFYMIYLTTNLFVHCHKWGKHMTYVEEGKIKRLTQSTTRPAVLSSQFHARLFPCSSKLVICCSPTTFLFICQDIL